MTSQGADFPNSMCFFISDEFSDRLEKEIKLESITEICIAKYGSFHYIIVITF